MIPRIADTNLCKVSCLRLGYVPFDNIDGNVDRHCLNFLFIILYHLHIPFLYRTLHFWLIRFSQFYLYRGAILNRRRL